MGAMVEAGPGLTRLRLNDATAWSGTATSPDDSLPDLAPGQGADLLAAARAALDAGDEPRAAAHLRHLQSTHTQAYLPFVDLELEVHAADGPATGDGPAGMVTRWLDLRTGIATHRTEVSGTTANHETWASNPARLVVHTLRADRDVAVTLRTSSGLRGSTARTATGDLVHSVRLPVDVTPNHEPADVHVRYGPASRNGELLARVLIDGRPVDDPHRVLLPAGSTLVALLATGTADADGAGRLREELRRRIDTAASRHLDTLQAEHLADHDALFARCRLTLPAGPSSALPTDDRLRAHEIDPAADPELPALLFHLGRYLLAASSRPGGPAANLQGIWNDSLPAPWSSNYTININTQMSYWPAEVTDLPECAEPLIDLVRRIATSTGPMAAQRLYGLPGWVAHHNADLWGHAAPVGAGGGDAAWSAWPMGGVWLTQHLAEHLVFRPEIDAARVRTELWPAVRDACRFAVAWVRRHPDGTADTSPATSPENHYLTAGGTPAALTPTSRMDIDLLRALARSARTLAEAADVRDPVVDELAAAVAALPTPAVGPRGELLEWDVARDEAEPEHRHLSHLVGLYPLGLWDPKSEPALAEAARVTLTRRGEESTGWSLAWRLALWARLRDPERAARVLALATRVATDDGPAHRGGLYPNLFSAHPPFQIDGNLGLTAGIAELLLQSRPGRLDLLPCLPWPDGAVTGLRARGGVRVNLRWRAHQLEEAVLTADTHQQVEVHHGGRHNRLFLAAGEAVTLDATLAPRPPEVSEARR